MKYILNKLLKVFESKLPLEEYITSKTPLTHADVEYWTKHFFDTQLRRL